MQEAFLYKANSLIFSDNWIMILNPIIIRSSAEGTVVYVSRLFLPWPLPTISLRSIIIPRSVLNCHPLFRWLSKLKVTVSIQWSIHCWRTPRRGCRKWIQYLWANHKKFIKHSCTSGWKFGSFYISHMSFSATSFRICYLSWISE